MTTIAQTQVETRTQSMMPVVLVAATGLFLIAFSGFAGASAFHNAAHDTRHTLAFPCH